MSWGSPRALAVMTVGWAVIGLLVGHVAAYDLVFPDAHAHAAALGDPGHAWLGMLQPTVLVALVVVVVGSWRATNTGRSRGVRFRRLALLQVAAFVAVELGERLMSGHSVDMLGHELTDHSLWLILIVGVAVQVVTAWLGAAASHHLVAALAQAPVASPTRGRVLWVPTVDARVHDRRPSAGGHGRAPPRSLAGMTT